MNGDNDNDHHDPLMTKYDDCVIAKFNGSQLIYPCKIQITGYFLLPKKW